MNRSFVVQISAFLFFLSNVLAFAESTPEGQLPSIVQSAIKKTRHGCKTSSPSYAFVVENDVNGDGRKDYILDYEKFQCDGKQSFCGSAGCTRQVFVSRNDTYLQVLNETVLALEFEIVKGKPAMLVYHRGTACGKDYSNECILLRIWNGRTFLPE